MYLTTFEFLSYIFIQQLDQKNPYEEQQTLNLGEVISFISILNNK